MTRKLLGILVCLVLFLAVTAFEYPNPAPSISQDTASVSVMPNLSLSELGTTSLRMHCGIQLIKQRLDGDAMHCCA
jgi:hypothetical protein